MYKCELGNKRDFLVMENYSMLKEWIQGCVVNRVIHKWYWCTQTSLDPEVVTTKEQKETATRSHQNLVIPFTVKSNMQFIRITVFCNLVVFIQFNTDSWKGRLARALLRNRRQDWKGCAAKLHGSIECHNYIRKERCSVM